MLNVRLLVYIVVGIVACLNTVSAAPVGDPAQGKSKIGACVECHGVSGNSEVPIWPKIAQFSEKYLLKQLEDFRNGESGGRFEPNMYNMVKDLSSQDLADVAAYYSEQKAIIGETEADKFELGQKIYRGGNIKTGVSACSSCHAPNGNGSKLANFPRLSGQNAEYMADQLKKFRSGDRSNDLNGIMRDISARMTDAEIDAVSSYVSGLH